MPWQWALRGRHEGRLCAPKFCWCPHKSTKYSKEWLDESGIKRINVAQKILGGLTFLNDWTQSSVSQNSVRWKLFDHQTLAFRFTVDLGAIQGTVAGCWVRISTPMCTLHRLCYLGTDDNLWGKGTCYSMSERNQGLEMVGSEPKVTGRCSEPSELHEHPGAVLTGMQREGRHEMGRGKDRCRESRAGTPVLEQYEHLGCSISPSLQGYRFW